MVFPEIIGKSTGVVNSLVGHIVAVSWMQFSVISGEHNLPQNLLFQVTDCPLPLLLFSLSPSSMDCIVHMSLRAEYPMSSFYSAF